MADGHLDGVVTRNARQLLAKQQREALEGGAEFSLRDLAREAAVYLYRCDHRDRVKIDNLRRTLFGYLALPHLPESPEFVEALREKTAWRVDVLEAFAYALQVKPERLLESYQPIVEAPLASEELDLVAQHWRQRADLSRGQTRVRLLRFARQLTEAMLQPSRLEFIMELVDCVFRPNPDEALIGLLDERKVPRSAAKRLPGTPDT